MEQLDIFADSADVMLRNDVMTALRQHDAAASQDALSRLASAYADDARLPDLRQLVDALVHPPVPVLDRTSAQIHLEIIETCFAPAAERIFGNKAADWLEPLWATLATALAEQAFDPSDETLHPAPLYLRACDWKAAAEHCEAIPSWRRQPAPLAWQIEARFHLKGLADVWPLLCGLAWMDSPRAEALARRLPEPKLTALLREFDSSFENTDAAIPDFAWFPAWLLIAHPQIKDAVRLAPAGTNNRPERCARQVLALLTLERQGQQRTLASERQKLKGLHEGVFALYMQHR